MLTPTVILTKLRNRYRHYRTMIPRERRLKKAVLQTRPMPLPSTGPLELHMLCSHSRIHDAIAALKSFYRFLPPSPLQSKIENQKSKIPPSPPNVPLVFHDDGSLTPADLSLVTSHFPNIRIISRKQADPEIESWLIRSNLHHCLALRRSQNYQLKLFDFAYYSNFKPFMQLDSDILFLQKPTELLEAMTQPPDTFIDRYNQDIEDSYTWNFPTIKKVLNVDMIPRYNVGLVLLKRDPSSFEFYNHVMASMPKEGSTPYFLEQTLTALESSRHGAKPLSPNYDVAGNISKSSPNTIITQHYCSTYRPHFYDDFCNKVFPQLQSTSPSSSS